MDNILRDNGTRLADMCAKDYIGKHERDHIVTILQEKLMTTFKAKWQTTVNRTDSVLNNNGGNKLRTYTLFKSEYETEHYVRMYSLTRTRRSALAKFRMGVAPLRLETGRYENLAIEDRTCFHCTELIEDVEHVITQCPLYSEIRAELFANINSVISGFHLLCSTEKLCHILSNNDVLKFSAKACNDILLKRRSILYR